MFTLSACTALKFVPKDEVLYTGAKMQIITDAKIEKKGQIKADVKSILRPDPNFNFLGSRPMLWLYYKLGTPKKKKSLKAFLKNKLAEDPVYMSSVDLSLIIKGIDARLYNTGFLDSYSDYQVTKDKKGKTASVTFRLHLKAPFTIQQLYFLQDTSALAKVINGTANNTLVKNGDRYSLDVLLKERNRIEADLKNHGYYFFNGDYILYAMDTSMANRTVTLHTTIKNTIPAKSRMVYHIDQVNVYSDYKIGRDTVNAEKIVLDSINYYKESDYIRPKAVVNAIMFRPDSIYDRRVQQVTLNRLNGLGVFKFLNVSIRDEDTIARGRLIANIYLTPLPRQSLSLEAQMVTKSNDFIGPGVNISMRNRNLFKGAELIIYNLKGSFETQYSGQYKGLFTYEIDPHVELDIPRFIPHFRVKKTNEFVPRTKFTLDYSYLSRVGYFDMNSFKLGIGYKWKQNLEISHDLTLLNVSYYNIYHTTDSFNVLINDNPLLQRRFETQFLAGIAYSFIYNEQVKPLKKNQVYFNLNVELSGNALALFSYLITKRAVNANSPSQVLGVNFAQFARMDIDVRDYYHLRHNQMMAFRFIAGWGKPYGNSSVLPYAKQFFSGGAYSLRGFPANSVGPGSYSPPDSVNNVFYQQQGGEIKLEANAEYRFPIFKFIKGALFADAGNTWLNKPNVDAPGGQLKANNLLSEIALSTGAGVRLDLSFFVFRLDIGLPLRNPAVATPSRWVIDNTTFKSLMFNLAFGYPF